MRLRRLMPIAVGGALAAGTWAVCVPPAAAALAASCRAIPIITAQWSTGFVVQFDIVNTGGTPISGWTVTFDLPGGDRIAGVWGATVGQSGEEVTATDSGPFNTAIPPGGSVEAFGLTVSGTDTALSDLACLATG